GRLRAEYREADRCAASRAPPSATYIDGRRPYFGELSQGSFRSKNSGTPTLSLSISSIWAFSSGGGSLLSPSRASASEVKYSAMVQVLSGWATPRLPRTSGRNA